MLFLELIKKEIKQNQVRIVVLGTAFVFWQLFLQQRLTVWPQDLVSALGIMTLMAIPFLAVVFSIPAFMGEWKHKTIYLLGSLPISMLTIGTAKLLAIVVELFLYTGISLINPIRFILENRPLIIPPSLPGLTSEALLAGQAVFFIAAYLVAIVALGALAQWSILLGRTAWRFSWLLSVLLFGAGGWFIMQGTRVLAPLFGWLPQVVMVGRGSMGGLPHYYVSYINSGPLLVVLVLSLALLVVGSEIYERHLKL